MNVLFLDRDGVINIDYGYVHKSSEFDVMPGIFELCRKAEALNFQIIVVTNQSGIAREIYTEREFNVLTNWMIDLFKQQSINILDVLYCPHHPEYPYQGVDECDCRKPKPGMILDAAEKYRIQLSRSIFVGDKESDMLAAKQASIPVRILLSKHTNSHHQQYHTHHCRHLYEVAALLV